MTDAQHHGQRGLDRLTLFSDGVFAIAITLLAIEIHSPHLPRDAGAAAWEAALSALVPGMLAFVLSFMVIGLIWIQHLRLLSLVVRIEPWLLRCNLLMLMSVSFLPFSTSLLGETDPNPVPFAFYAANLLLIALLKAACTLAALRPSLLDPAVPATTAASMRRASAIMPAMAALTLLLAFIAPGWNTLALLGIPLLGRARFFRPRAAPAA